MPADPFHGAGRQAAADQAGLERLDLRGPNAGQGAGPEGGQDVRAQVGLGVAAGVGTPDAGGEPEVGELGERLIAGVGVPCTARG